jgi:uncharacterized membrane protein YdfJ with MMPL/SSD domain
MFRYLGQWIARRPGWLVLAWAAMVVAGATWASQQTTRPPEDMGSFLPASHPANKAIQLARQAFPKLDSRSQVVAIACRPEGLTAAAAARASRTVR